MVYLFLVLVGEDLSDLPNVGPGGLQDAFVILDSFLGGVVNCGFLERKTHGN